MWESKLGNTVYENGKIAYLFSQTPNQLIIISYLYKHGA